MNLTTNDDTLVLISPCSTAKITMECLEDIEHYHGEEILKEVLLKLYQSVSQPQHFGKGISMKLRPSTVDFATEKF